MSIALLTYGHLTTGSFTTGNRSGGKLAWTTPFGGIRGEPPVTTGYVSGATYCKSRSLIECA